MSVKAKKTLTNSVYNFIYYFSSTLFDFSILKWTTN